MNYFIFGLFLYSLWLLLVLYLDKRGILNKYNITIVWIVIMPILMLRTLKGQKFLDRLAIPKKFWRLFANIGLPAMLIGMFAMFILILFIDYSMLSAFQTQTVPPPGKFSEPRNIFLIPGINEYIPLWYGIIALIITLVVHEFSHAILCKVEGIKVKSMGILLAILPIGGFAEPDEEQLLGKKEDKDEPALAQAEPKRFATRRQRIRILTSGVMANFVTALIAFILFFSLLSSVSPVGEVMVTKVLPGSPADLKGVKSDMIITGINDIQVNNAQDFLLYARTLQPGSNITLNLIDHGVRKEINFITVASNETRSVVRVLKVIEGSPAEAAGIKPDMVLVKINDTEIKGFEDFISFMNSTRPRQKLEVYLMSDSSENATLEVFKNIELVKYPEKDVEKGFLGISYDAATSYSAGIGIGQFPAKRYLSILNSIPSSLNNLGGWLLLFSLPIFGPLTGEGFPGFSDLITNFYEPTGWAVPLGAGIFLILNALMWIGWMNFYVGLFNCLPAVPLDGGHVFRDVMSSSLSRIIGDGEKVEKLSNAIAIIFALLILLSLLFVTFAPYAAQVF